MRKKPHGSIGFVDGQLLVLASAMTACSLGYHKSLDFLFAQPGLGQPFERRQWQPVRDGQRQVCLGSNERPKDRRPSKLAGHLFDDCS